MCYYVNVPTKSVKRAFKYRFYPTDEQASLLSRTFGCVRVVYNRALAERARAWTQDQTKVGYHETSTLLTEWKKQKELDFLGEVSSVPLQQSLRHLQGAYVNFWEKRAGYPKFKSKKNRKNSAEFTKSAFTWDAAKSELKLAKMDEPLNIVWSRDIPSGSVPSSVTVSRDQANRWFVSILTEFDIAALPDADKAVGIDLGINALATLSDGTVFHSPDMTKDRARLHRAQRAHARKAKGSRNREKARLKAARISARITDSRRNNLHQITTKIVRENQVIAIEDLNVRGMSASGGSSKRGLNRALQNSAFAEFRSMLEYKAEWYGRTVIAIDRFYPSTKQCSSCGNLRNIALSERVYRCHACGYVENRDLNAAKNIKAAGLAVFAYGGTVRPARAKARAARAVEVGKLAERSAGIPRL